MGKRSRQALGWSGFAAVAIAATAAFSPPEPPALAPDRPVTAAAAAAVTEDRLVSALQREALDKPAGALFASRSWDPPKTKAAAAAPAVPVAPTPPPVPYRAVGTVVHDGKPRVVLARGDRVLLVQRGDVLDGGYRVDSVQPDGITLVYVPLDASTTLPLDIAHAGIEAAVPEASSPPPVESVPAVASGPAQLRWEGPESVRAGSTFDLALKVTSEQPVRGSPVQLAFTPELLEPVAVRPGRFYAGANFNYRINPKGYIMVGASRKAQPASDAELLVLTFRSKQAGATAEVKLSSVVLQGDAGAVIDHHQPSLFRTAILQ